jgi:outer membrane protein
MKKILFALALTVCAIATTQAQAKIGHVKSQTLLDTMPSRKAAIKEIKEIENAGLRELKDADSAIQVAYMKYQADVQSGKLVSQSVKEYEENRIRRMQQNLEERQQQIDQQLQIMTQEMNVVILDRVKKAVNIVATAKKFNYIIDESTTLYSAGGVDVTNEVIVELLKLEAEAKKTGK